MVRTPRAKRHAPRTPAMKNSFPMAKEEAAREDRRAGYGQPSCFAASSFMISSAPPPIIITFTSR